MHVAIVARGRVDDVASALATAEAVAQRLGASILLIDPEAVYSPRHIESAVVHAERAWREGRAAAKTLSAEILLYLAGEHQVQRAIERCGIRPGLERVVVVACGEKGAAAAWGVLDKLGWSKDPQGVRENPAALARHGISTGANGDAEKRILERVALVDLRK